jgi:ElaB/YqjD/DUF883 family membrane-anchored ribosome-binding protein
MDATATAANAKQSLATSLRRMIDEADHLLSTAADTGDEAFDTVRDEFSEQVRKMRAQVEQLEDAAAYRARRAARLADRTVHDHPHGAMGAAAALGLLIGFLAARR